MFLFRRRHKQFEVNPLSLTIQQNAFESWAHEKVQKDAASGSKTKSLSTMTADDLMEKPRPWKDFFALDRIKYAYGLPDNIRRDTVDRITVNVYDYIGNYLRLALVLVLCVLYKNPMALLGIIIIAKSWDWIRVRGVEVDQQSFIYKLQYILVHILSWILLVFSQVAMALSLASFLTLSVVCFHGALRKPGLLLKSKR